MAFADNLSRLQAIRGETNYRLAKDIGVHQTTIKNWKNGVTPQIGHIRLIASHYGVSVEELMECRGQS